MTALLTLENISIYFETDEGTVNAAEDVSFRIDRGEIVGLVGESGCGKSVTALNILRLIPSPPGRIQGGRMIFKDYDLLNASYEEMRRIRGHDISMIFQEPGSAMSPLQTIGDQLVEAIRLHRDMSKKQAWELAETWLKKVGIPDAVERMFIYPYQMSGGMQQRVMIAMALMMEPELVIADEPTTALDVTIQAQVFDLIRSMRKKETSILLITHDMGVVWEMCDRVMVMYASKIVEQGRLSDIFNKPAHPYTQGLLQSIPKLGGQSGRLMAIPGQVPAAINYPPGCRFHDRCPKAFDQCKITMPELIDLGIGHKSACLLNA